MFSPEMVELILKGGLIAFLAIAWLLERQRADKEREKNEILARESITQSAKTEATLDKLASILSGRTNGP